MVCRWTAIIVGLLVLLSVAIGGATYTITAGYQRAYDELVWTDGGTVFPAPKAKPAARPRNDDKDWLENIFPGGNGPLR